MKGGRTAALRSFLGATLVLSVTGCATTGTADPADPWEGFNRGVYSFNQTMDKMLFDPLGKGYQAITPDIVDRGISNMFSNLNDISVIANDILQFKFNQALTDALRFVYNSTAGLLGFFDVSTPIGMPKNDEDFGQTLAVWGVGSGPYLVVPFFGPSTVRDAVGFGADSLLNPVMYLDNDAVRAGLLSLNYVDFKADLLSAKTLLGEAALDEYDFVKSAYLEKRDAQINDRTVTEYSEE